VEVETSLFLSVQAVSSHWAQPGYLYRDKAIVKRAILIGMQLWIELAVARRAKEQPYGDG
jgi:hypothetical protein